MRVQHILAVAVLVGLSTATSAVTVNNALTSHAGLSVSHTGDDFDATFGAGGLTLARTAGGSSNFGGVSVSPNFSFSGNFTVQVDTFGLFTGLPDNGEAGLFVAIAGGGGFSDIYGYNNNGSLLTVNNLGLDPNGLFGTDITGGKRLTITGNTGAQTYRAAVFLIQQFGNTPFNSVTFRNLRVEADQFVSDVPEPASWSLMLVGFGLVGATVRRCHSNRAPAAALS